MLAAFAEAGRYLQRSDYTAVARQNADFLLRELHPADRLQRSWRAGRAEHNGFLEDYAALILGLLSLYQSDPDVRWYVEAERLAAEMLAHFRDPAGGFFDTRDDHEALITRPKEKQDNATPSGSALAATALLQLATYSGNGEMLKTAEGMLGSIQATASRYPTAFAQWLCAANFALAKGREIAIVGDPTSLDTNSLLKVVWRQWRSFDLTAVSNLPPAAGSPALLADRPLKGGKATAYVCKNFACELPVNNPADLDKLL
jgi:hypothetical protein